MCADSRADAKSIACRMTRAIPAGGTTASTARPAKSLRPGSGRATDTAAVTRTPRRQCVSMPLAFACTLASLLTLRRYRSPRAASRPPRHLLLRWARRWRASIQMAAGIRQSCRRCTMAATRSLWIGRTATPTTKGSRPATFARGPAQRPAAVSAAVLKRAALSASLLIRCAACTDTGPIYPGRQPHPELAVGVRVTHSEYGDGTLIGMCTRTRY